MTKAEPYDVVAIGAAIVDILARVDDAFLQEHGVAKAGMTLVDGARADAVQAEIAKLPDWRVRSGGSAANTAAGLAALGARTLFVGKTKDDQTGRVFKDDMDSIGVDTVVSPIPLADEGHSARCFVFVTPDAQRSMCTDLGVSGLLSVEDVPLDAVTSAKILYLEGYLWDREGAKRAFETAMEAAKAGGGAEEQVALTLSDKFCVERHRDSFRRIVSGPVDILFANEAEIMALYETDDFDAAAAAAAKDAPLAVLTRSEKGCVVMAGGRRIDQPAEPIGELVDTTGAGDLFAAGFLYGRVTGRDLETCARMGCVAAAEVIQHVGGRPESDLSAQFRAAGF